MSELEKFKAAEIAKAEAQRQKFMEEHDYKDFIRWPVNEATEFKLLPVVPREHESFGTLKMAFRITVGGTEYDWSVNPNSPMYVDIVKHLGSKPVGGKLLRTGEGKGTRYGITWKGE